MSEYRTKDYSQQTTGYETELVGTGRKKVVIKTFLVIKLGSSTS